VGSSCECALTLTLTLTLEGHSGEQLRVRAIMVLIYVVFLFQPTIVKAPPPPLPSPPPPRVAERRSFFCVLLFLLVLIFIVICVYPAWQGALMLFTCVPVGDASLLYLQMNIDCGSASHGAWQWGVGVATVIFAVVAPSYKFYKLYEARDLIAGGVLFCFPSCLPAFLPSCLPPPHTSRALTCPPTRRTRKR
jgi:hypothetical protein